MNELTNVTINEVKDLEKQALSNLRSDDNFWYIGGTNRAKNEVNALQKGFLIAENLSVTNTKLLEEALVEYCSLERNIDSIKEFGLVRYARIAYLFEKAKKVKINGTEYKSASNVLTNYFRCPSSTISGYKGVFERYFVYLESTKDITYKDKAYQELFDILPYSYLEKSLKYDDDEIERAFKIWNERPIEEKTNRNQWLDLLKELRNKDKEEQKIVDSTAKEVDNSTDEKTDEQSKVTVVETTINDNPFEKETDYKIEYNHIYSELVKINVKSVSKDELAKILDNLIAEMSTKLD